MARPCVVAGGTASNMEGSCKYIEKAVTDSRQWVVILLRGWVGCEKLLTIKTYTVMKYTLVPLTWTDPLAWDQNMYRWQALVNTVMKLWVS
jgi:hypothetical protein